ncbi:MAG: helix-turn-helix domain-containing protein [Candidatus Cryptobacteroides sp.]
MKEVTSAEIAEIGDFWPLPKSGFFLCTHGMMTIGNHDRFYILRPNDIIVYPVRTTVYIKEYTPDIKGLIGMTELENLLEIASRTVDMTEGMSILTQPCRHLDDDQMGKIEEIAAIIRKRAAEEEGHESLAFISLWKAMCYDIADIYKVTDDVRQGTDRNDTIFLNFLFSIKNNVRKHRDVQFYAKQQCLSTRYFSTLIKSRSGMSPLELITKAALTDAKILLADSSLTVKEISYELGFPSPSFFGRWFKHNEGISPAKYRKTKLS